MFDNDYYLITNYNSSWTSMPTKNVFWTMLLLPMLLSFVLDSMFVLNFTYADALFLSSYPESWLFYYYLADPVITILLFFIASRLLTKESSKQVLYIIYTIPILLITYFAKDKIYAAPFIMSLLIYSFTKIIFAAGWNAIATSFEIGFFKAYIFRFSIAGVIGSIVTAFGIPLLIHYTGTNTLFYIALVLIASSALCIMKLRPLPVKVSANKQERIGGTLYKQPFFIAVFLFTVITYCVAALAQFSFQQALMGSYNQEGLATFISLFHGSITIIGLLMQLFFAKKLLTGLGLFGILVTLPVLCFVIGISIAIWPIFILFIAFNAIQLFFNDHFITNVREIMLNPYPCAVRIKASMYIRGQAAPIGGLIGAGMIFIVQHTSITWIGIFVCALALPWIYLSFRSTKGYQDLLYISLKENRYDPSLLNISSEAGYLIRDELLKALHSNDLNVIVTGLSFFDNPTLAVQLKDNQVVRAVAGYVSHPDATIRIQAANALNQMNAQDARDDLLTQFLIEHDLEAGWAILDTLVSLGIFADFYQAKVYCQSKPPFILAYGIISLEQLGDESARAFYAPLIIKLLTQSDEDKKSLALMQKYLPVTEQNNKNLITLLSDESDTVSIAVMQTIQANTPSEIIPILFQYLKIPERVYYAEKGLGVFKERIIGLLLEANSSMPRRQLQANIRLLAQTGKAQALEKLISLSQESDVTLRHFIAVNVLRSIRFNTMEKNTHFAAILTLLQWITDEMIGLLILKHEEDPGVAREILLQMRINRAVFLAWFGLITDVNRVASVASYIERPEDCDSADTSKAYELLDSLSPQASLRNLVAKLSQEYSKEKDINQITSLNPSIVMLINNPFLYQENNTMNNINKISLLRRVKLFKDIPVESLKILAEVAIEKDMSEGEYIFKQGDESFGFYCIVSGGVTIKIDDMILLELQETDYFGELGTLDGSVRTTSAIAATDGLLLYIEKNEFMRVLEDFPEIMKAVISQIIRYLRTNLRLAQEKKENV